MELLLKHAHLIVDENREYNDIDLYIKDEQRFISQVVVWSTSNKEE